MARTKIAIACQGGGSQTAFTAGALKALLESDAREHFEVVAVSGTSGGAVCAALVWYALRKGEDPLWRRVIEFWNDNTARGWIENTFNGGVIESMRLVNRGLMPMLQLSPASPLIQMWMQGMTLGARPTFTDFPGILKKYIDFDEIARWGVSEQRPVLILGAANVNTGALAKFVSSKQAIRLEHILASCAVTTLFPAVEIDGEFYWDGLFSDNPPVEELIRPRSVGAGNIPEEIWLIKINPTSRPDAPSDPDEISDRRNQMEGNISLFHQLDHIEMINDMILADAFRPKFLDEQGVRHPIRIPKAFDADPDKPYHIPCIEIPAEVASRLDYEGKLDRSAHNIDWLLAQGELAAKTFLRHRASMVAVRPLKGETSAA